MQYKYIIYSEIFYEYVKCFKPSYTHILGRNLPSPGTFCEFASLTFVASSSCSFMIITGFSPSSPNRKRTHNYYPILSDTNSKAAIISS